MKRSAVWRHHTGAWCVDILDQRRNRARRVRHQADTPAPEPRYPTHAAALTVAIEAVGLAPGNPEPMEAP